MQNNKVLELQLADENGLLDKPEKRRYCIQPLISNSKNGLKNVLHFKHILRKYPEKFFDYFRMSINSFDELLQKMGEPLNKMCNPNIQ